MHYLRLIFSPIPEPRRIVEPSGNELFAEIVLEVFDDDSATRIFSQYWDLRCLLDWFAENENHLLDDEIPPFFDRNLPVVTAIKAIYENYSDEQLDVVADCLYEFKEVHDLRFGLRGTDIPSTYLCKKGCDYEISWGMNNQYLSYRVDLEKFITSINRFKMTEVYLLVEARYLEEKLVLF